MTRFVRVALLAIIMAVPQLAAAEEPLYGPKEPKDLQEAVEMLLKAQFAVPVRCLRSTVSSSRFTYTFAVGISLFGTGPDAVPVLQEEAPALARRAFEFFQPSVAKFATEGGFDYVSDPPEPGSPEAKAASDRLRAFYELNPYLRPPPQYDTLTVHLREVLPENTLKRTAFKWRVTPEALPKCDFYEK